MQIVVSGVRMLIFNEETVIVTEAVDGHATGPVLVAVTVYVVVAIGVATGSCIRGLLNPAAGDQL